MDDKRILWIDTAKFIGIFLVILEHASNSIGLGVRDVYHGLNFAESFIESFHMPLFFIMAGFLYKNRSKYENLQKIIWSLLIPYFIYQFIYFPFFIGNAVVYHHQDFVDVLQQGIIGIFLGDGTSSSFSRVVCGPCWFIMTMILLRFFMLFFNLNNKNIIFILILSLITFKLLVYNHINLYLCIDNTLMAIPYFLFGYFIKIYFGKFFRQKRDWATLNIKNKIIDILTILLCIVSVIGIYKYNGVIKMYAVTANIEQYQSISLSYLGGLIGFYMIYKISSCIKNNTKFVCIIAENTLFIIFFSTFVMFLSHWIFIHRIHCFVYKYTGLFGIYLTVLIYALAVMYICYLTILVLKKYPLFLGKYDYKNYKKGRNK